MLADEPDVTYATFLGQRLWATLAALTLATVVSAVVWWIFVGRQWTDNIGAAGLIATIWGLVVSILGFSLTIWQLQRTRKASAAAADALLRLKRDFGSFDVITEARTARATAEETQEHIAAARWGPALSSYNKTRSSLNKMTSVKGGLADDQSERAQDFVAAALDACQALDILNRQAGVEVATDLMNTKLRELEGFLISVEYSQKDALRG